MKRQTVFAALAFAVILLMAGCRVLETERTDISLPASVNSDVAELLEAADSIQKSIDADQIAEAAEIVGDVLDDTTTDTEEASADSLATDSLAKEPVREKTAEEKKKDSLDIALKHHNQAINDSLHKDSLLRQKTSGIEKPVHYESSDSMTYFAADRLAFLYGDAKVTYDNMDLQAENIDMNMGTNIVHATGAWEDSTQTALTGTPEFKWGKDEYQSDTITFNYKTKKGLIKNVTTNQEDGLLYSQLSKRNGKDEIYIEHGRYTTCDAEHPDFYLALTRAKVRPGKDVVFGPAYLVVADVPLPLAIPYGFFPFSKSYSSGFIMPTYGDETARGFYLRDGGYYFAISDKIDLKLLGEVYTKGSWGFSLTSNYKKRYKYGGSFMFSYQDTRQSEQGMPDYNRQTSFKLQWSHRQDQKANPYSSLTASVNFASSSYEQNNLTSMYNPASRAQSTRASSVSWTTNFSSIGLSLSTTANLSQNMRDTTVAMTLPDLNIALSRFYPFKRKHAAGKERWYEKISMSYTGHISNSFSGKEDKLFHSNLARDWKNGWQHTIPVAASFTLFDYINVTPSFNLTDRTYMNKINRSWDEMRQVEVCDTTYGMHNVYNWNMSMSLSTKLYAFFGPNKKVFGEKFPVRNIRHVVTPMVSFSYAPDFSASRYGYYETYQKTDAQGNVSLVEYSPYTGMLYGVPGKGKTGSLSMSLSNNLEMKWYDSKKDTLKTVSLIDELGASMSYNMAAETRPWSDLSLKIRLKLTKSYTFNMNAVFATYAYTYDMEEKTDAQGNVTYVPGKPYLGTRSEWGLGKLGRFQGTSQNISYTLTPDKLKKLFSGKDDTLEQTKSGEDDDDEYDDEDDLDTNVDDMAKKETKKFRDKNKGGKASTDDDGYMAFNMPWSLSVGYGISMRENTDASKFKYGQSNGYNTGRYPFKFTQTLNLSGNLALAQGWNISFSSGYDFDNKKISMTTASLNRKLHCFSMSCSMVLAPYTSYNFSFRCDAQTLADVLKYDKRSGQTNAVQWY